MTLFTRIRPEMLQPSSACSFSLSAQPSFLHYDENLLNRDGELWKRDELARWLLDWRSSTPGSRTLREHPRKYCNILLQVPDLHNMSHNSSLVWRRSSCPSRFAALHYVSWVLVYRACQAGLSSHCEKYLVEVRH